MKQMPKIQKYMTKLPHTIGNDIPVIRAEAFMRSEGFRHLPVLAGGVLVGVLSDRDIKLAAALGDSTMKVEDVMMPDPFVVAPDAPLDRVVMEMAERKYGSAIVREQNGQIVGIFTAVDGLRVLSETLATYFQRSPEDPLRPRLAANKIMRKAKHAKQSKQRTY